jgi:polysaccharide pyruvyl transferase CsaB
MDAQTSGPRIGISGSYGGLNLGDEAILEGILGELKRELDADVVVFSRDPDDTKRRHGVDAVPVKTMTKEESRQVVEKLDLLILGGGGILYDRDAQAYLREVELAHDAGVPVMVYAVSAGPLRDPHVRQAVREALNRCAAVTVRDRYGERLLQDLGVEVPVIVTADPALLLKARELPKDAMHAEGLHAKERLIGFSVREPGPAAPDLDIDHYHLLVANAADFVIDRYDADVVFVPMERKKVDMQHSHAVVGQMKNAARASVLKGDYDAGQMLTLIGKFDFAVGMRLHFLIFAARQEVPFVSLPYSRKIDGFIEELELQVAPLDKLNAGTLLAHIDRSWDMQRTIRNRIAKHLPGLVERARMNQAIVNEILDRKETGKRARTRSAANG